MARDRGVRKERVIRDDTLQLKILMGLAAAGIRGSMAGDAIDHIVKQGVTFSHTKETE